MVSVGKLLAAYNVLHRVPESLNNVQLNVSAKPKFHPFSVTLSMGKLPGILHASVLDMILSLEEPLCFPKHTESKAEFIFWQGQLYRSQFPSITLHTHASRTL
jgi:hypothetical protein